MQKLILGRTLSLTPQFILACQPARGLDIGAGADPGASRLVVPGRLVGRRLVIGTADRRDRRDLDG